MAGLNYIESITPEWIQDNFKNVGSGDRVALAHNGDLNGWADAIRNVLSDPSRLPKGFFQMGSAQQLSYGISEVMKNGNPPGGGAQHDGTAVNQAAANQAPPRKMTNSEMIEGIIADSKPSFGAAKQGSI
jgi:hypothetical protein